MKKWRSIIAWVLVVLLVGSMLTGIIFSFAAHGASVSEMQDELNSLAKKREQLEADLEKLRDRKDSALEQKEILDQQIGDLSKEASLLDDLVSGLEEELDESRARLEQAEKDLESNTQRAKERIRATYELGGTSYAEIILSARSLHEFVTRVELVRQMAAYDKQVIDALKETHKTIEEETKAIEENKNAQQSALDQLEANVSALERKRSQSESLIESFEEKTEANKKALAEIDAAEDALRDEIRAALAARANSGSQESYSGGQFLWPLPGYSYISDPFGYRTHPITGVYKLHTGTDISGSGVRGARIVAAAGGTVIIAGYNKAYGNYVVIDHGGGYSTLYAHAQSLNVSVGESVSRGDTIAYVGDTGYATGPHLHFEIIHNGEYEDPMTYFN